MMKAACSAVVGCVVSVCQRLPRMPFPHLVPQWAIHSTFFLCVRENAEAATCVHAGVDLCVAEGRYGLGWVVLKYVIYVYVYVRIPRLRWWPVYATALKNWCLAECVLTHLNLNLYLSGAGREDPNFESHKRSSLNKKIKYIYFKYSKWSQLI